jgi:hypothetical protein
MPAHFTERDMRSLQTLLGKFIAAIQATSPGLCSDAHSRRGSLMPTGGASSQITGRATRADRCRSASPGWRR